MQVDRFETPVMLTLTEHSRKTRRGAEKSGNETEKKRKGLGEKKRDAWAKKRRRSGCYLLAGHLGLFILK